MKRLALLYTRPGSYTAACLKSLRARHGVSVMAVEYDISPNAPFDESPLSRIAKTYSRSEFNDAKVLARCVQDFRPDAVYVSGWSDGLYRKSARILRGSGKLVISGLDAQYKATLRQRIAGLIAPWFLHGSFDVMWAAGERQRYFAQKLGYAGNSCWQGLLCGDWERFASAKNRNQARKPRFLYVGRYVEAKGLDVLMDAYRLYRRNSPDPWPLVCAGAGPMGHLLSSVEGVDDLGFVQPTDVPELMASSTAFVLPSRHEPWGVVVQEAAAAGLPLLCSDRVGAAVHMLKDGYNGCWFPSGDSQALATRMLEISALPGDRWTMMSDASYMLSQQYKPDSWADLLMTQVARWNAGPDTIASSNPRR